MRRTHLALVLSLLNLSRLALAEDPFPVDMALEDLARQEVATVSRKTQRLSETPAAVTVLSAEDIRRSGARSVPEALREVPGVSVAQIGAGRWAVGVRMAEGRFSNKLLVQIDGRSVYNPLFSGVFWESLDLVMEDIERIEVVRGPGASLWGANAVNGVINIVTRKATGTQGSLVSARVDDAGKPALAVRQGFELGEVGAMRLYAKASELRPAMQAGSREEADQNYGWNAGFRIDGAGAGVNGWMLQGSAFRRSSAESLAAIDYTNSPVLFPIGLEFRGSNLVGRYNWGMLGGEASVQAYYDYLGASVGGYGHGDVNTFDVDFQHRLPLLGVHELMWGAGARYVKTVIDTTTPILDVSPYGRSMQIASAFVQDEISLKPRVWRLTLGVRMEHSTLSHLEPQPTARLTWTPTEEDSVWTSWSRAARTPSVGEVDASIYFGVRQTGDPRLPLVFSRSMPGVGWQPRAERVDAMELGYRRTLGNGSFELVAFHHDYRRLISEASDPAGLVLPGIPLPVPPYYLPIMNTYRGNLDSSTSYGVEAGLDLPVNEWLRLQASYTAVKVAVRRGTDPVTNAVAQETEGSSPDHWATLHGQFRVGRRQELDLMLRRVGAIRRGDVPGYTATDLRYSWRVNKGFELSLMGLNLFDQRHMEYMSNFFTSQPAYIGRQGYIQGVWRF